MSVFCHYFYRGGEGGCLSVKSPSPCPGLEMFSLFPRPVVRFCNSHSFSFPAVPCQKGVPIFQKFECWPAKLAV